MKRSLILAGLVCAFSASGSEIWPLPSMPGDEKSFLVENPSYPGTEYALLASAATDETGVCVRLGFKKYLMGSGVYARDSAFAILVDRAGAPEKSERTRPLKRLVCIDRADALPSHASLTTVREPSHVESKLPIIAELEADETGVCAYLGFADYLKGSAKYDSSRSVESIVLDRAGRTVWAARTSRLKSLICLNP